LPYGSTTVKETIRRFSQVINPRLIVVFTGALSPALHAGDILRPEPACSTNSGLISRLTSTPSCGMLLPAPAGCRARSELFHRLAVVILRFIQALPDGGHIVHEQAHFVVQLAGAIGNLLRVAALCS
jgi:hypothetical protein